MSHILESLKFIQIFILWDDKYSFLLFYFFFYTINKCDFKNE
jgi:hypothetical protein